jgi:hypothetical protein
MMADTPIFALDASVFIEAKRRYYAFDIAPVFWENLIHHAQDSRLRSIDRVRRELEQGGNLLARWASSDFSHAFVSTDDERTMRAYGEVMTRVQGDDQYLSAAKSEFASGADGWLIAHAVAKGDTVVTQEELRPDARRKVPIPNICRDFNVAFVDTFEMLRRLGVRWTR